MARWTRLMLVGGLLALFSGGCPPALPDRDAVPGGLSIISSPLTDADVSAAADRGAADVGVADDATMGPELASLTEMSVQRQRDYDLDGFLNHVDPAPYDPTDPADLGSPEKILNDPLVLQALDEAAARGLMLQPVTEFDPNVSIAGTYAWTAESTEFTITSDQTCEGCWAATGEINLVEKEPGLYHANSAYPESAVGAYQGTSTVYVRGSESNLTLFAVGRVACSDTAPRYAASIASVTRDPATGDLLDQTKLSVIISGVAMDTCELPGGENPGGWQVVTKARLERW